MAVLKVGSSGIFLDPIHKNLTSEDYYGISLAVDRSRDIHRNGDYSEIEFFLRVATDDISKEDLRLLESSMGSFYETVGNCLARSRPGERCKAASALVRVLVDCVRDWYDEPEQPLRGALGEGWLDIRECQAVVLTYETSESWLFKFRLARTCQKVEWFDRLPVVH